MRSSSSGSGHMTPPLACHVMACLRITCSPPPQLTVQPPSLTQSSSTQSTGHASVLQSIVCSRVTSQALPNSLPASVTVRVCLSVPPPQVTVQPFESSVHSESSQSTGQGSFSQSVSSVRGSVHGSPPCSALISTDRLWLFLPGPHSVVHSLHEPHWPRTQWIGHSATLHDSASESSSSLGQATPPSAISVSMDRVRVLLPSPQEVEHPPQPVHCETTQSTGQFSVLQSSSL